MKDLVPDSFFFAFKLLIYYIFLSFYTMLKKEVYSRNNSSKPSIGLG